MDSRLISPVIRTDLNASGFLGDSVDSRRIDPRDGLAVGCGFWGIVWTAGVKGSWHIDEGSGSFWGIVWTAGN